MSRCESLDEAGAAQRLADLDISSRLESDLCGLLGSLHADEAIPLLVKLAWSRLAILESLSFVIYLTSSEHRGSSSNRQYRGSRDQEGNRGGRCRSGGGF